MTIRGFSISTIKSAWALITGGFTGLIKYIVIAINTQILSRIKDKETALLYLRDVQAAILLISTVLDNHKDCLSEARQKAGKAILESLNTLAAALEDFEVDEAELDAIIASINAAIDAWKAAK